MKDTTIQLTPPIDGVQYGIKTVEEKGHYTMDFGSHFIAKYDDYNPLRDCWQVLFSTNPKDIRFPYLVLPSKEQEYIKKLAQKVFDEHKGPASENEANYLNGRYNGIIEGFNANPAKYTQEQMEEAFEAGYDLNTWEQLEIPNNEREYLDFNNYFQSLQPTAKAVRVEMELEIVGQYYPESSNIFTASGYKIKVEKSTEYSQGIVRTIEVIY